MAWHPWVPSCKTLRGEGKRLCNISVGSFAGEVGALLLNSCRNVVGNKLVVRVV